MTRREHEIRREIADKLQARIAEDPYFRLYELGVEAGHLLMSGGDNARQLELNFQEARLLLKVCRSRGRPAPPDYTSAF